MNNQALLKKAEEFSKRPQIRKRTNQFDQWKEVVSYLKSKDLPTKEVLNFILQEDSTFAQKYKGRESTAYALLSKYVKKHFRVGTIRLKEDVKIQKSKPQKVEEQNINKNSKLEDESNEDKEKMIAHFGKEFVEQGGVEMAKVVYEMSRK